MLRPHCILLGKETPNKQFEPITCLDRDHDPEVMKTIEVG
jgi:hypothetical protein